MTLASTRRSTANVTPRGVPGRSATAPLLGDGIIGAPGANPALARAVRRIDVGQYAARGSTTFCNQAFHAYAMQHGYEKLAGSLANEMFRFMDNPANGWRRATADEAIEAAAAGKLVAAAWYNNSARPGRPDGRAPGHIAAVVGEYAPGVPGIAQAGGVTFEWGPVSAARHPDPTYFILKRATRVE
jgi:hypothetical protein